MTSDADVIKALIVQVYSTNSPKWHTRVLQIQHMCMRQGSKYNIQFQEPVKCKWPLEQPTEEDL